MNEDFVDVDFRKCPQYVFGDLGGAGLSRFANYAEVTPRMTEDGVRAEIEKIDEAGGGLDKLVTRIYDQQQEGSCVANATCQAHEIAQAEQYGRDKVVHLSAISLYKRIGRSAQSGAVVSDAIEELQERGVLPLDTPENRERFGSAVMPNTGFKTPFPADWEATGRKFASLKFYVVTHYLDLLTALCYGDPVVVGRQGHSICYVRPMWQNGFRVKYANSWGDWGDEGFGYDTIGQIKQSANWAFAVRTVRHGQ